MPAATSRSSSKHELSLGKSLSLGVFVGCVAYHLAILAILAK